MPTPAAGPGKRCPICKKSYDQGTVCPEDGATLVSMGRDADPLEGRLLKDTYRIEGKIGAGGMGAVYRATQLPLGRSVAVKVLLPSLQSRENLQQRFFREARLLAELNHPNVVTLIDFGNTEDGLLYMVMEHLAGRTLADLVGSKGLPLASVLPVYMQICDAVGAAHLKSLVHRDLKPANIFLADISGRKGVVKVLDFGIGKAIGSDDSDLTRTGVAMGTASFISPEQINSAADVDQRSDIYALGAILYYMLSGRRPYTGDSTQAVFLKQIHQPPDPIDLPKLGLPEALGPVLLKAMAMDREDRYATTADLWHAVRDASGMKVIHAASPELLPPASPSAASTDTTGTYPGPGESRGRRRILGVCSVLVALLLGGGLLARYHGHAKDASPPPAPPAESGVRGVSATEVLVGLTAPFSGPEAANGEAIQYGIRAAFNEVNDQGGIQGRHLALCPMDDGYDPRRSVENTRALLMDKGAFCLVGSYGTAGTEASLPTFFGEKALLFGSFSGSDALRKVPPDRYVFNFRASSAEEAAALVRYFLVMRRLPPSSIAVLTQDDAFGEAVYAGVVRQLKANGYFKPSFRVSYSKATGDTTEAADAIEKQGDQVRAVILAAKSQPASSFILRLEEKKSQVAFAAISGVGPSALAEKLMTAGAQYVDGVIVTQVVPHVDSDLPAVKAYRAALKEYFPAEPPLFVGEEGYLAARTLCEALRRTGPNLDTESLIDTLEGMHDLGADLGQRISFGPSEHQGLHKVWGTRLNRQGRFEEIQLER